MNKNFSKNHNTLWDKNVALREFQTTPLKPKELCIYFGGEEHWRKYYNDIWKWKESDPQFKLEYERYMERVGSSTRPGREPKDGGDKSWQQLFCDEYVKTGSRKKASLVTPYAFSTILEMLDANSTNADPDFIKLVRSAELELSSEAEEKLIESVRFFDEMPTLDDAKIIDIQSRAAERLASKLDWKRFGKRIELTGTIDHKHQIEAKPIRLISLIKEQQEFLAGKGQSLPLALPPSEEEGEIIDLEVEEVDRQPVS